MVIDLEISTGITETAAVTGTQRSTKAREGDRARVPSLCLLAYQPASDPKQAIFAFGMTFFVKSE
jgi:hypothetical protein